jgi:ribosomal protein S18 acetylase RimI-like enzyme
MIAELTSDFVHTVATIHQTVLPADLLSRLGVPFMERYLYSRVVNSPSAVGYVYLYNQQVVGYITGTIDSDAFYRMQPAELATLPLTMVPSIVRNPLLIRELVEAMQFVQVKGGLKFINSEIASVGVLPEFRSIEFYRAHKLNIAAQLNLHLLRELRSRGVKELFGIFDSKNTLALVSYQNLGFTTRHEFLFHGTRRLVMSANLCSEALARRLRQSDE